MSNKENVNENDIKWIKEALKRIEKQTTKTNGRVDGLEKWKERIVGMTVAASGIVTFVINKLT